MSGACSRDIHEPTMPLRAPTSSESFRASAGPILKLAVQDNQLVKEGDLLFEIDPAD